MIAFVWPWALWFLPLPLAARWLRAAPADSAGAIRLPFCRALLALPGSEPGAGLGAGRWPLWLLWGLLVFSLAQPVWVDPKRPALASGRDLLLLLDTSGSMRQMDFSSEERPLSRFELVKQSAQRFLARRGSDRVGLILFGAKPFLRAPPTWDHRALRELIEEAGIALAGEATAIGDAVGLGIKTLRDSSATSKVMVLITDGANNEGMVDPRQAARLAASLGIRLYTIGIGKPEAPAPNPWGVWSTRGAARFERAVLSDMANLTGGRFAHALDADALDKALAAIDALEPTPDPHLALHLALPLHPWLLAAALGLSGWLAWRRS
jgi:Ca-activated chloride channel family protein